MNVDLIKTDFSKISTHFLAGVAEQGLPIHSNDPDEIRVNDALFDGTTGLFPKHIYHREGLNGNTIVEIPAE